jgi:protein TonB
VTRSDAAGVTVEVAEANLLHRAPVDYPREALAKGIQGTVVLEVDIDETGNVSDAKVLSGPQELRKAALQSVLQWHYSKNMSLPAKTQVSVDFKLPPPAAHGSTPKPERQPVVPPSRGVDGEIFGGPLAAADPPVLRIIDLSSLPEALQKELREKIGKYEGQPLSKDVLPEITRTIATVDDHLRVSVIQDPKAAEGPATSSLRVTLSTAGPTVAVWSKDAPPTSSAAPGTPQRIRVGGNVQQAMLVSQPRPVYPPAAKLARVQGLVRLNAIIGKDGAIQNLDVVSGHPLLVPAALDAVRNWVYKTTLLNGEPVEVITTIDVNFTLTQ